MLKDKDIFDKFVWRLEEIVYQGPTKEAEEDVQKNIFLNKGQPLSATQVNVLETLLNKQLTDYKKITLKRKWFSHKLLVIIEKYTPIAKIDAQNGVFFVAEDGTIFQDKNPLTIDRLLNISLNDIISNKVLSKDLLILLKEISNTFDKVSDFELDLVSNICVFNIDEGQVKIQDFAFGKEKIQVLREILTKAKEKDFIKPYFIDFTYYENDKVYLRQRFNTQKKEVYVKK